MSLAEAVRPKSGRTEAVTQGLNLLSFEGG